LRRVNDVQAGWYPDPASRFELRYHNGVAWTADVSTNGDRYVDPLGTGPGAAVHQNTQQPTQQTRQQPGARNGAATASMVLGIVTIVVGWLPFIFAMAAVAGVMAIVLGLRARRRAKAPGPQFGVGNGMARAGLILGPIGLLVCVGGLIFSIVMVRAIETFENPADNATAITSCERNGNDVTAQGELTNISSNASSFTVRVFFVRPGTDNPRRQANVIISDVEPGEKRSFEVVRSVQLEKVDCIIGSVRGELPFGVDPGD
jgi:hypothetical protein|tara:strand:- start:6349 stop:7128 length:780 start_codon:yes stop_codon:yes gene_type:complete